tara:strand:+ start:149 stop:625 length:477 start_codon:yes stop_codon:yes gene_type:complete
MERLKKISMNKIVLILMLFAVTTQAQVCDYLEVGGSLQFFTVYNGQYPGAMIQTSDVNGNIIQTTYGSNYQQVHASNLGIEVDTVVVYYLSCTGSECNDTFAYIGNNFWTKISTTTFVNEIKINNNNNNKIYDLLGKELKTIPNNKLYIKNNKLYYEQ